MKPLTSVCVQVPATSANLGPGFDCLGIAWRRYNRFKIGPGAGIQVSGPGHESISRGSDNLAWQAAVKLFRFVQKPFNDLALTIELAIPPARGLGSSSSAIVGGLMAANAYLGNPLTKAQIYPLAVELEGHPDNVAPALFGGLRASLISPQGPVQLHLPWPGLVGVLAIPPFRLETEKSRAALPESVSHRDARFNVAHAALLVGALATSQLDLLPVAGQDRLHEPYRTPLVPGLAEIKRAALEAGALLSCLSGAGPTVLALCTPETAGAVAQAMGEVWHNAVIETLQADFTGATPVG